MTFERIQALFAEKLNANPLLITMDTDFWEELDADSLDLVEVVLRAEEEFGIKIPGDISRHFTKVGDIVKYIDANK